MRRESKKIAVQIASIIAAMVFAMFVACLSLPAQVAWAVDVYVPADGGGTTASSPCQAANLPAAVPASGEFERYGETVTCSFSSATKHVLSGYYGGINGDYYECVYDIVDPEPAFPTKMARLYSQDGTVKYSVETYYDGDSLISYYIERWLSDHAEQYETYGAVAFILNGGDYVACDPRFSWSTPYTGNVPQAVLDAIAADVLSELPAGSSNVSVDSFDGGPYLSIATGDVKGYCVHAAAYHYEAAGGESQSGNMAQLDTTYSADGRSNARYYRLLGVDPLPSPLIDPSVGTQSGSGSTRLFMTARDSREHGGYAVDEENPDETGGGANGDEPDGLGDNLAFTVPSSINYVVKADGTLMGPSNAYIENRSAFSVHVSAMQAKASQGWNIVADVSLETGHNLVDVQIGPDGYELDVADYVGQKANVENASQWNMSATTSGTSDQLPLSTSGHASNLSANLSNATEFATINWYVTPGDV